MGKLLEEIKSRRLLQTLVVYLGGAWVAIEVSDLFIQRFALSVIVFDLMLIFVIAGIPGSLTIAWFHCKKGGQKITSKEILVQATIFLFAVVAAVFTINGSDDPNAVITEDHSIAVLPFADMSEQKNQEYFCDGITEEIINDLAKLSSLRVVARTSSFQFKGRDVDIREVGDKLNVNSVLEGSVRKAGDKLRITAQLINVNDGYHLWSDTFDRELKDIFAIQDEIALAVVSQIKAVLTPEEQSRLATTVVVDPKAHEDYLKGLHRLHADTEVDLLQSIEYFRHAVEIAPTYTVAYLGLADAYQRITSNGFMAAAEGYPKAIAAVNRALELEPELNEAHLALARIKFTLEWDWEGAEREFLRVLEQNPNSAKGHERYAIFLTIMRRFEEANKEILKARDLDPLSAWINDNVGMIYLFQGRYKEALVEYQKTLEMYPNFTMAYHEQSVVYMSLGMPDMAIEAAQKAVRIIPDDPYNVAYLGLAYAMAGEREKAKQIIEQIMERSKTKAIPLYELGLIFGALGDNDKAFEYLEQSVEKKSSWTFQIRIDPAADKLRSDPRYAPLVRKMGLEP